MSDGIKNEPGAPVLRRPALLCDTRRIVVNLALVAISEEVGYLLTPIALRELALGSSRCQHAGDFAEDRADTAGYTRHDRAGGNRHKTGHQRVFNEVLRAGVFPNSQFPNQMSNSCHLLFGSLQRKLLSCRYRNIQHDFEK